MAGVKLKIKKGAKIIQTSKYKYHTNSNKQPCQNQNRFKKSVIRKRALKPVSTILLAMFAVAGIYLAGSETENFMVQILACTGGVMLFASSLLMIAAINRGKN